MRPRPRDLLAHPLSLFAIGLLLLNDHVLKAMVPSWWTGKLSDVAGMIFFPLFALALVDVVWRVPRRVSSIAVAIGVTSIVFALVKCVPQMTDAYRVVLGMLQTPLRGSFARVSAVTDPTDLLAIPFALLAFVPARSWLRNHSEIRSARG